MKYLILLPLLLIFSNTFSQEKNIKKDKWHWNNKMKKDTTAGYCQVLKVDNVLYISGAVTTDLSPKGIQAVYNDQKRLWPVLGQHFNMW
ncbi:hypothetical protein [Sphingobacterium multivorum]|uniref:hypothetical protein n=1 Tax=Sphingobacterium multivorum TaxID=28454 RepID=UPI0028B0F5D5|nr:hypothetical protein [Sphingobacterium multivorum]